MLLVLSVLVVLLVAISIYLVIRAFSVPSLYKSATPAEKDGPEVIIIGSGMVGSILAAVLAHDGRRVTVIERSLAKPDRATAETIVAYGVSVLKTLGLADCLEDIGTVPSLGRHFVDIESKKELEILYEDYQQGQHFLYGNFVQSLRRAAQAEKRCTYIEGNVSALIQEDGIVNGIRFKEKGTGDMQELRAPLTVVADGAFSHLRKANIQQKPTHLGVILALEHKGPFGRDGLKHVYMTKNETVVFYQIAENQWRIKVDIAGAAPKNVKEVLKHIGDELPADVQELYMDAIENSPIRTYHTFTFPLRTNFKPGVLTLGDALNMCHPLASSGISLACRDVYLWRNYLRNIPNLEDVKAMHKAHRRFQISRQIPALVCNVNTAMIYQLLKAREDIGCLMRSKFIDFLEGSKYWKKLNTDMAVLVDGNPLHLIWYNLAIILYYGKCVVQREPWYLFPKGLLNGGRLVADMTWHVVSLLWNELKGIEI